MFYAQSAATAKGHIAIRAKQTAFLKEVKRLIHYFIFTHSTFEGWGKHGENEVE